MVCKRGTLGSWCPFVCPLAFGGKPEPAELLETAFRLVWFDILKLFDNSGLQVKLYFKQMVLKMRG